MKIREDLGDKERRNNMKRLKFSINFIILVFFSLIHLIFIDFKFDTLNYLMLKLVIINRVKYENTTC